MACSGKMAVQEIFTLMINQSGLYWIEAISLDGCLSRTVSLLISASGGLYPSGQPGTCNGEQLVLRPKLPETGTIRWQDGSGQPGVYR